MAIGLQKLLRALRVSQAALARHCHVSTATISELCRKGKWPTEPMASELRESITVFLMGKKILPGLIGTAFEVVSEVAQPGGTLVGPDQLSDQSQEDLDMLLRKQTLTPAARKLFGLARDPFDDLQCDADFWQSGDIRYVREQMYQTARYGGIVAVIAESGAGKTSIRRSLLQRIHNESLPIVIAQPYMLAAEDNDQKGKTLKSTHIAEAILRACAPLERPKLSSEARFAQLHRVLIDNCKSGQRVCLIIEEAHSVPVPTLKHLKRVYELEPESGYGSLLSIILLGQQELLQKLDERNPHLRELVQRCQVFELQPIAVAELEDFIDFRLGRVGKKAADVIDAGGINAIVQRLVNRDQKSQLYPLAVGNFMVAALNYAATIGVPAIDADIVNEVA